MPKDQSYGIGPMILTDLPSIRAHNQQTFQLIRCTVQGDCGLHRSIEEWQKCQACERIGRNKMRQRD